MTYIWEFWAVWHTLEKTEWCDIHRRILGCVTYIEENWVVWHTLENSGLCDIHWRKLNGVTYIGEFWAVWNTLEKTGWCDIRTHARTDARTDARTHGEICGTKVFHYRGTQIGSSWKMRVYATLFVSLERLQLVCNTFEIRDFLLVMNSMFLQLSSCVIILNKKPGVTILSRTGE